MKIVDEAEFRRIVSNIQRRWRGVIVHHFASPRAADYQGRATWASVQRYHMNVRGWSDIGYHVGVAPDSSLWLLRRRDKGGDRGYIDAFGAHCTGYNGTFAGFVLAGDFTNEDPHRYGYDMLVKALAWFIGGRNLTANEIRFHREFAATACPGYRMNLAQLRRDVAQYMQQSELVVPDTDPRPPVPLLAVVIGSSQVPCQPKTYKGQLYVLPEPFCASMGVPVPEGVHVHESGYALATAIMARIPDWQLFYRGPDSGLPYHRWYPKHISWE